MSNALARRASAFGMKIIDHRRSRLPEARKASLPSPTIWFLSDSTKVTLSTCSSRSS
ncbi:hypothetical protein BJY01DRAFT_227425 [Aspergillus pseudoustus]|uniref:Uncharacterized protein n=1 Tax=Aspergillus pseudoustus TaxID=1810923 RepID=A0ABR4IQZ7_9EURO